MGNRPQPGLLTRVAQGLSYAATGKAPPAWFGPLTPMVPIAEPVPIGRQFDYPAGYNLRIRPREDERVGFEELRGLADAWDVLRLVIETRKDQLERQAWTVRPRPGVPTRENDPRIALVQRLLECPDGEHGWAAWLRMLLEDLFVIDAPSLYLRRDRRGGLAALEIVDGATIKRILDDGGRTPLPPDPAYQQILKGVPAVDYSTEDLLYAPRNPRPHKVYGFSPVEQVLLTVNIAIRRQASQLAYFTEGNTPEALIGVPESWTPEQIRQFQEYWDALLEGNLEARRHSRFVPGGLRYQPTREPPLKDEFDEWLARVACFAFSVPPTPFIRQMNRATADTAQEAALEEGLAPLMAWLKALVDRVIRRVLGFDDLEFAWVAETSTDLAKQAEVDTAYVAAGIKSRNEIRATLGLDPLPGGDALTVAGPVQALAQVLSGGPVAKAGFNPDEARDGRGRWTGDGGGAAARPDLRYGQARATLVAATSAAPAPAEPSVPPMEMPGRPTAPPPPPANENRLPAPSAGGAGAARWAALDEALGRISGWAILGAFAYGLGDMAGQYYADPATGRAAAIAGFVRGQLMPGSPEGNAMLNALPISPFAYGMGEDAVVKDANALLSLKAGYPVDIRTTDPNEIARIVGMPWPDAATITANAEKLANPPQASSEPTASDQSSAPQSETDPYEKVREELCDVACACLADPDRAGQKTFQACMAAEFRNRYYDPESGQHPQGGPRYPKSPDADGPRPEMSHRMDQDGNYRFVESRLYPGMPTTAAVVADAPRPDFSWWLRGKLWKIIEVKFKNAMGYLNGLTDMQAEGKYRDIAKSYGLDPDNDVIYFDVDKECACGKSRDEDGES
jgi:hypothetical protein